MSKSEPSRDRPAERMLQERHEGPPGVGWREQFIGGSREAEAAAFEDFARQINEIQARQDSMPRRALHAKAHMGINNAEFRVVEDLPPGFDVPPFLPGAIMKATVRLSSAAGRYEHDRKPDMRGLAVRVSSGAGTSHDFLMTNAPASHARDARQFMLAAVANSDPSRLRALLALLKGIGVRETLRMLRVVRQSSRRIDSLATETYWSRAAMSWGGIAVRFLMRPSQETLRATLPGVDHTDHNYLRLELARRLRKGPLTFEFCVQCYVNEQVTPIEDGAAEWSEAVTSPIKLGELVIPQQDLQSIEAKLTEVEIEKLEFSPWNTTELFRPLGNLNRARAPVYESGAAFRAGRKHHDA